MNGVLRFVWRLLTLHLVMLAVIAQAACAETDSSRVARLFLWASEGGVRYRDLVEPAKDSLAKMGEGAAPHLARLLNTSDARERLTLAEIFEKMGKVATPFIVPYLDSAGEDYPKNAARALARIKDTAAVEPLMSQMDHPLYAVRSDVATALGRTGDSQALDSLIVHLRIDIDADVRKSCAFAVGAIGDSRAGAVLMESGLRDPFFGVRQCATIALSQWGDWVTTNLAEFDVEPELRDVWDHGAIVACGGLQGKRARDRLLQMLKDSDPRIRGFAVEGMSQKDAHKSLKQVLKLKEKETDPFVLAQIARFEEIAIEHAQSQSR